MPMPHAGPARTGPARRTESAAAARSAAPFAVIEKWVHRHLGRVDHERRVAEIAATVFDLTKPLHDLSAADARLLRLAAFVHDVGRSVDDAEHPRHGAAMVLADESLPLPDSQRRALAYLTLYHRGPVPAAGDDDVLHPEDDHPRLRRVLALLRCADALDSRSRETPRLAFALVADGRRRGCPVLRITCYLQSRDEKVRRVYKRRKKFRLLEETMGCRVDVEVARAEKMRLVA